MIVPSAKEYFQMKKESLQRDDYQKKLHRHRQKTIIIILICFVVLGSLAAGAYYFNLSRVFKGYRVITESKRNETDITNYIEYNGDILKYNMDGISCTDLNGEVLWNQTFEMQNPQVDTCEQYVAVCDQEGNKAYILNEEGLQGEVETQLPIRRIRVANKGMIAVLMEDGDVNRINYYDKDGTLLAENKASVEKSGFPMDIALSNDGLKLAVSYMILENGVIQSKLAFYNFDSVGENEIDHLVSGADYAESIIPKIEFVNNTTAAVFGDNFFAVYQGTQKPVSIYEESFKDEVKSIFYDDKYIGFVLKNADADEPYRIEVYNLKGSKVVTKNIGVEYNSIQIRNGLIYLTNEAECIIYNLKGKEKFKGNLDESIETIIPISERKVVAVLEDKVQLLNFK